MGAHNIPYKLTKSEFPVSGISEIIPGVGALRAWGTTVPADASEGYAPGCIFQHTDGGDGTSLYVNEGTMAACDFNAVTVA